MCFCSRICEILRAHHWTRKRSPLEVKVQTIREFPTPTSKTDIRAFLGQVGYYQRYIPQFSIIAAPLTDKLKVSEKKEKVEWKPG